MDHKNTNTNVTEFEKKGQEKVKNKEKLIVTASAVFVLTALTLTGMYMNHTASQPEPVEETQSVDSFTVENPDRTNKQIVQKEELTPAAESSHTLVLPQKQEDAAQPVMEEAMSDIVENMTFSFDGMNMLWPVAKNSEVLIPYSMDRAVYFKTLDQYKYSPAMIIAAEEGTPVCAVSAGRITRRYWDYETGWTYEMDLGGGFKAYYGQLDNLQKAENTYVAAGDVLGYVASPTKYFAEEGSNLYFAMTQNERPVSPETYMGE